MQKLILVFYINIAGLRRQQAEREIYALIQAYEEQHKENDMLTYWFPIQEGETRLECINPQRLNDDEYEQVLERVQNLENYFDKLIKFNRSEEETNHESWVEES